MITTSNHNKNLLPYGEVIKETDYIIHHTLGRILVSDHCKDFVGKEYKPNLMPAIFRFKKIPIDLPDLQKYCHEQSKEAGWWDNANEDNRPTKLLLMISEISEAMEGHRKDLMDDKLPHRKMEEVELGDTVIRIFDYAEFYGYDLFGAICEKLVFNTKREDHKQENRNKSGGKKF